jgi:hypothetical protein
VRRLGLAAIVALLVGGGCGPIDEPASAVVSGQRYAVGGVNGLAIEETDLAPFARMEDIKGDYYRDEQAYTLGAVDPRAFLVARTSPELEAGPDWGPFVGLWGSGKDPELCPFFRHDAPAWCVRFDGAEIDCGPIPDGESCLIALTVALTAQFNPPPAWELSIRRPNAQDDCAELVVHPCDENGAVVEIRSGDTVQDVPLVRTQDGWVRHDLIR